MINKIVGAVVAFFGIVSALFSVYFFGKVKGKDKEDFSIMEQDLEKIQQIKKQNDHIDQMDNSEIKQQMQKEGFVKN